MNFILFAIEVLVWLLIFSQIQIILKFNALMRESSDALNLLGLHGQIALKKNLLLNKKILVVLSIVNQVAFYIKYEFKFDWISATSIVFGSLVFCILYILLRKFYILTSAPGVSKTFYVLPESIEAYGWIVLPVLSAIIWLVAF